MESVFSTMTPERTDRRTYVSRDLACADVFDDSERFYNPRRRQSTLGQVSWHQFEKARPSLGSCSGIRGKPRQINDALGSE